MWVDKLNFKIIDSFRKWATWIQNSSYNILQLNTKNRKVIQILNTFTCKYKNKKVTICKLQKLPGRKPNKCREMKMLFTTFLLGWSIFDVECKIFPILGI